MNSSKELKTQQKPQYLQLEFLNFVSQPVAPGSEKARKMTVGSGEKLLESLPKSSRNGASLRMLEDYLVLKGEWYSKICYLSWKPLVTKQGRLLFQLAPKTPRTDGTGCGLLPTARAQEPGATREGYGISLSEKVEGRRQIAMLPTPTGQEVEHPKAELTETGRRKTKDGKNSHSLNVADRIAMLKTPTASEGIGGAKTADKYWNAKAPKLKLRDQIAKVGMPPTQEIGKNPGLKLQPGFVEYMMGYPKNYTNLKLTTEWQD